MSVFLLATWPRRLAVGLVLLIPVVIGLAGGFRTTEPRSYEVAAGETVDLGPMTVRPVAFFVSDETARSWLEVTEGAEAWVGVIVDVENTTDSTFSLTFPGPASDAVVPQVDETQLVDAVSTASYAYRVEDYSEGGRALPSVPTQVALLWALADADAVGDTLTVTMTESVWTYGPMSGEESWMSLGDRWSVQLPRVDLPPSMYEPEDS